MNNLHCLAGKDSCYVINRSHVLHENYDNFIRKMGFQVISTGPEVLLSEETTKPHKTFWMLAISACIAISIFQIYGRFIYFLSVPIAVDTKLSADQEMFPDISICFDNLTDSFPVHHALSNSTDSNTSVTIQQLWDLATTDLQRILFSCTIAQTIPAAGCGNFSVTSTPTGPCLTKQSDKSEMQLGNGIYLLLNTSVPIKVVVHPSHTPPFGTLATKQYILKPNSKSTFSISTDKFIFYNSSRHVCITRSEQNECFRRCLFHLEMERQVCKTKYVDNLPLNYCSMANWSLSTNISKSISQVSLEECECNPVCVLYPHATEVNCDETTGQYTDVHIAMASSVAQITTQHAVYGFDSLLAEMGGSFGLFLGLSCLSLIELIERLLMRFAISTK